MNVYQCRTCQATIYTTLEGVAAVIYHADHSHDSLVGQDGADLRLVGSMDCLASV